MSTSFRDLKNKLLKQPPKPTGVMGFLKQYLRALRFYLVTGLMVWIPLIVTVWLTWWLFKNVGLGIENLIENLYGRLNALGARVSQLSFLEELRYRRGLGFLIAIALFLTTGFFARYLIGRRIINTLERILQQIPGVRGVYKSVQQIRDVFINRGGAVVQRVVLIEYPRKGVYAVAFQTSSQCLSVERSLNEGDIVSVFMPTTPNPTTGFLMYLPAADVIVLDMTVEDAMKLVISGGAYDPAQKVVDVDALPDAEIPTARVNSR